MNFNSNQEVKLSLPGTLVLHSKNLNSLMHKTIKSNIEGLKKTRDEIVNLIDNHIMDINLKFKIYDENTENLNKMNIENSELIKINSPLNKFAEEFEILRQDHILSSSLIKEIENLKLKFKNILNVASGKLEDIHLLNFEKEKIYENINSLQSESFNEPTQENEEFSINEKSINKITKRKPRPIYMKQMINSYKNGGSNWYEDILYNKDYEQFFRGLKKGEYKHFTTHVKDFVKLNNYSLKFKAQKDDFLQKKIRLKYFKIMSYDHISKNGCYHYKTFLKHKDSTFIKMNFIPEYMDDFMKIYMPRLIKNFNYYFYQIKRENIIFFGECTLFRTIEQKFHRHALVKTHIVSWKIKCFTHEVDMFKHFDEDKMDDHNLTDEYIEELAHRNNEMEDIRYFYSKLLIRRIKKLYN